MKLTTFNLLLFLAIPTYGSAQTSPSFLELQKLSAPDIAASDFLDPPIPMEKSWGVTYSLKGVVSVEGNRAYLNTADGRLFALDLSAKKAGRLDGKTVIVTAQGRQADDLSILKVEKISEYSPSPDEITPPPYQPRRRQALLLAERDGSLTMGNVRTLRDPAPLWDKFDWTAMTIRPDLIKNVYFVKKPFAPEIVAAHSFLLFTFEKGGLKDASGNEPLGLTLSIEGRTRVGQNFSPVTGVMNKFGIIWQLATWEDYASRTVQLEKGHLVPYPVLLSHEEKAKLLTESMRLAAVDREGEFYHTIKNNCTNNLLIILNRVLPEKRRIKMWTLPYMVYNIRATMPLMVISNLQERGLLGQEFIDITTDTLGTRIE